MQVIFKAQLFVFGNSFYIDNVIFFCLCTILFQALYSVQLTHMQAITKGVYSLKTSIPLSSVYPNILVHKVTLFMIRVSTLFNRTVKQNP